MANNITQLASQLVFAHQSAGGFKATIKSLGSSLMGSGGLLLIISLVVAALEKWDSAMSKVENKAKALSETLGGQAGTISKLLTYAEVVETSSKETNEYKNAMKALKDEGFDPATQSLQRFIDEQIRLIKVRAKAKVVEDELNELFTKQVENQEKQREIQQKIDRLEGDKKNLKVGQRVRKERIQAQIDINKETLEELKELGDEIAKEAQKVDLELSDLTKTALGIKTPSDRKKGRAGRRAKVKPIDPSLDTTEERAEQNMKLSTVFEEVFGYSAEDMIQANVDMIKLTEDFQKDKNLIEAKAAAEREGIAKMEYEYKMNMLSLTSNGLMAFADIAGKQTAVGKALAVASTTVSTYSAAQKAFESQMTLTPDSPIRGKIAYGIAVAQGLATVKNILAVKSPYMREGGSRNVSSGQGGREFDFNLVGSTGNNQLAQAVGGQFQDQTVRAYVVGSDITNRQQLDNKIKTTATFGD